MIIGCVSDTDNVILFGWKIVTIASSWRSKWCCWVLIMQMMMMLITIPRYWQVWHSWRDSSEKWSSDNRGGWRGWWLWWSLEWWQPRAGGGDMMVIVILQSSPEWHRWHDGLQLINGQHPPSKLLRPTFINFHVKLRNVAANWCKIWVIAHRNQIYRQDMMIMI